MDQKRKDRTTGAAQKVKGAAGNEEIIQVIEERVVVEKAVMDTGKVRIRKTVTEETASVNIPIINESYDITTVKVPLQTLDAPPPALRYEGETTIIPVVREITVVQKKYEVMEEIHITRVLTETPLSQEIVLRKEHIDIDRTTTL